MSTIDTISELLQLSDSQYRIFDIGRKIDKLTKSQFEKIENNQLPYPFPAQGHAHLAIAFWQKQSHSPYLWFVKLPLDERGLLNQGARNHFIAIIVEALGSDLTVDPTEQQEKLLSNNPYHFTPSQYKLASLNSLIKVELKQKPSEYLQSFIDYLTKANWQQWQHIGVQGITDFAARISQDNHSELLTESLIHLPSQVLLPLCSALENQPLSEPLVKTIIDMMSRDNVASDHEVKSHLLRSIASTANHPYVAELVDTMLQDNSLTMEDVITLSGRCWSVLANNDRMMRYLEAIVANNDNELFAAIFKDLVAIPELRTILFQCMREPNRSEAFSKAIGQLFNQASN